MRGAGFGLLGLLLVAGIMFWVSFGPMGKNAPNGTVGQTLQKGKEARGQANQIAGRDADGVPAGESVVLDAVNVDGHLRRLRVVSVVPTGPFATDYKLRAGDEITDAGPLGIGDNDDAGLAKALVLDAYQRNQPIVVRRDGQKLTLTPTASPLSQLNPKLFAPPAGAAVPTH